jgi:hypothetical protein
MQRIIYGSFDVSFLYGGDQNLMLDFFSIQNERDLVVALRYWGGIPRWTGKVGQVAIQGDQAFIKCDFALGRSSDPLGQSQNKDSHAIHELLKFIHDGVYTKKAGGYIAVPSGSVPYQVTSGYDLDADGFNGREIKWVDF